MILLMNKSNAFLLKECLKSITYVNKTSSRTLAVSRCKSLCSPGNKVLDHQKHTKFTHWTSAMKSLHTRMDNLVRNISRRTHLVVLRRLQVISGSVFWLKYTLWQWKVQKLRDFFNCFYADKNLPGAYLSLQRNKASKLLGKSNSISAFVRVSSNMRKHKIYPIFWRIWNFKNITWLKSNYFNIR